MAGPDADHTRIEGIRGVLTDLDTARDPQALAIWRRQIAALYEVQIPASKNGYFRVAGTTWQLPHGFLTSARGSAVGLLRSSDFVARNPVDVISIFRLRKGLVTADYDGRSIKLSAGDLVMIDYARPLRTRSTAFVAESVMVPRKYMPVRAREGKHHGVALAADTPLAQLLGRQMDVLFNVVEILNVIEAQAALDAFVGLASTLWPLGLIDDPVVALIDRAKALIFDEIGNAELNVAIIAERVQTSRTALFTVFAAEGGVKAFIQKTRLDEALKELVARSPRHGLVKDTAERFGFKSVAHFSRAFHLRFGCTPSEAQALSSQSVGGYRFSEWIASRAVLPDADTICEWMRRVSKPCLSRP